jgi:DNA-directed RNA polymerase subunit RPC12/RpoP
MKYSCDNCGHQFDEPAIACGQCREYAGAALQNYSEEICPKCSHMRFTQQNVKYFVESTPMEFGATHDELYACCEGVWFLIKGPHMERVSTGPDMAKSTEIAWRKLYTHSRSAHFGPFSVEQAAFSELAKGKK